MKFERSIAVAELKIYTKIRIESEKKTVTLLNSQKLVAIRHFYVDDNIQSDENRVALLLFASRQRA